MTWIKFHSELRDGRKRGLSRASRFVYLELSLLSRASRGVIDLPRGMNVPDAIHDILGGSRKEIGVALDDLCSEEFDMIRVEEDNGHQRVVVVNWAKWNAIDESAARRQRDSRSRRNGHVTRDVTDMSRVTHGDVTRLDQRRSEKRRSDPPNPRDGGSDFSKNPEPDSEPQTLVADAREVASAQAQVLANLDALGVAVAPFADGDS